ncbi:MAG: acyltransferase family protein [Eubacteriales bacterium]|nr:acyltransferase family protein [Eubacteriales bacterium]
MFQPTKQRDPSLDLVRCIALFFVMAVHFCTHCDIYNAGYVGVWGFVTELLRTLYVPALALFIMLNGYFQNKKTLSGKYYLGILKLYEMYLLCAVLNLLYSHFYLGMPLTARSFFGSIINFEASEYSWYVLLYNGLFLMIPFLNIIYNSLTCRGHKRVLILTFFFLSALPSSFLNVFANLDAFWWQRLWPIMFYFMGAYVREYRNELRGKKWGVWLLVTLTVFSLYNYLLYHTESPLYGLANNVFLYSHEGLQNAVLTPLVFLLTLDMKLDNCPKTVLKMMKTVSDCSYGAFLFSSITDSFVYGWLNHFVPVIAHRYLFFVIALPISYVSAVFLAFLADKPVKAADKLIRPLAERFIMWLYRLTAPDAKE